MIAKCPYCHTYRDVDLTAATRCSPRPEGPDVYSVRCEACTRNFDFTPEHEKKLCQYVNDHYKIPAYVGMLVWYEGARGKIVEDRGHYIGVRFDTESVDIVHNFHPTLADLVYDLPGRKTTIREDLEARPWPQWVKDLFIKRCLEYSLDDIHTLQNCFIWTRTPEGLDFWDRLITRNEIKENDIKEIKVQEKNVALKDILEAMPVLSNTDIDHIMVKGINQLKHRATDRQDFVALMTKYDELRKNFDMLVAEKAELQCELKDLKKHMQKILEAVTSTP